VSCQESYPAEREGGKKRMRKESSTRISAFHADVEPYPIEKPAFSEELF
jgi:hypothetical protein